MPEGDLAAAGIPSTYVPFRNANMLCVAVSWAEVIGARRIYIGAVEEDSSGYPDCRWDFLQNFEKTADLGTKKNTKIYIKAPLIKMSKSRIVKEGQRLGVDFMLTSSCYDPLEDGSACGQCDSCRLREKGFKEGRKEGVFFLYSSYSAGKSSFILFFSV